VRVPSGAMSQFELEQFERSGDRLRVEGRWSDVRGMRFMRPTLTIGDRRVLAVLDHKPWAPEEGQPWIAEFPWEGADVDPTLAELAVAPSVAVPLSSPGVPVEPSKKAASTPDPLIAEQERSHRYEAEIAFLREQIELLTGRLAAAEERPAPVAEPRVVDGRADELETQLAKVRAELDNARDRLTDERERRAAAEAAYDQLRVDRDATQLELNHVREELADKQVVLPDEPASGIVAVGAPPPPPIEKPEPAPLVTALESWIPRFALVVFGVCILLLLVGAIKVV
jgi:hypothetical protein